MTPEVHTEGGRFVLDLVDDGAAPNEQRWRIALERGGLQVVLFDASTCEHRVVQITRTGIIPEITRGGTL